MAVQSSNPNLTQMPINQPAAAPKNENMAGMRMAAPVANSFLKFKMARDEIQFAKQSAYELKTMYSASSTAGGVLGNLGSKIGSTFTLGGTISGSFKAFFGALKSNFAISALLSGISNIYEMASGKVKPMQAVGNFVADTAAYTTIGATATTIGGFLGSFIPLPVIGPLIGIAIGGGIGLLLGKLYEDKLRPGFSGMVTQGVQSLTTAASAQIKGAPNTAPAAPAPTTPSTPAPSTP